MLQEKIKLNSALHADLIFIMEMIPTKNIVTIPVQQNLPTKLEPSRRRVCIAVNYILVEGKNTAHKSVWGSQKEKQ